MLQLVPSWPTFVLGATGLSVFGGGLLLAGLFWAVSSNKHTGEHDGLISNFLLALLVTPVATLFLLLAGVFPGRTAMRGLMLLSGAGVLLVGGASCAEVFITASPVPPTTAWAFGLGSYGALAAVFAVGGLAFVAFTPVWVREDLAARRLDWLVDTLRREGATTVDALAIGLGSPREDVRQLAIDAVAMDRIALRWDDAHQAVLTAEHVAKTSAQLVDRIATTGRTPVAVLAGEVGLPDGLTEDLIDELIAAGALPASLDRQTREVVFRPVERGEGLVQRWCAGCGGPLRALGAGLGRCAACGREEEL